MRKHQRIYKEIDIIEQKYVLVKTMQGDFYYSKVGYDNFNLTTNPVKINKTLIPLSNIEFMKYGLTYNEVMEIIK